MFRFAQPIRFSHCDPAGVLYFPHVFDFVNAAMEDWFAQRLGLPFHCGKPDEAALAKLVQKQAELVRTTLTAGDYRRQTVAILARRLARPAEQRRDVMRLDGKTAIVTGAAWGIGRATAILFFASSQSQFVTGQMPSVSGGLTMAG